MEEICQQVNLDFLEIIFANKFRFRL